MSTFMALMLLVLLVSINCALWDIAARLQLLVNKK